MLGHPTKSCYVFKDILQALIDAEVLKLRPEQKKVTANVTSVLQFGKQPPTPAGVVPIPRGELRVVNTDPHQQQEKGLVPVPTPQGEIMWVHPDLVDGQQWTTVTNRKSKGKAKASSCHVVCASSREAEDDVPSLTDSEEETIVLAAEPNQSMTGTRSGQPYLKQYGEVAANPPQPAAEPTRPSTKPPVEKQKETRFSRALQKGIAEGSTTPYRFDVLAQLANIPARITLYELLRLSKSTREALQEALANAEVFMTQVPKEEDVENCLHTSQNAPCITFTADDMQVKGKHDRPLYFTGYIGSSEVNRIQVDPGSALSIMPRRVMQHLGIPTHR